ncbi:MAG: GNAT family N-acetyltransferase [Paracoccus sp. (in: a-proteobacteria)]|uniref:GNAT family N-acetyltransferase n=1 Tax=Paracoccus sp. TaxID=267 RepID=UPI0032D99D7E
MRTLGPFLASTVERSVRCTETLPVPAWSIWCELRHLEAVYPNFKNWYWDKVVPGVPLRNRRIFVSMDNGQISGILIAKKQSEKKICTVWVPPKFRRRSVARDLMKNAITWLETPYPLFTVPDERMSEFSKLTDFFGFERGEVAVDFYGHGRIEHTFNGSLMPPFHA